MWLSKLNLIKIRLMRRHSICTTYICFDIVSGKLFTLKQYHCPRAFRHEKTILSQIKNIANTPEICLNASNTSNFLVYPYIAGKPLHKEQNAIQKLSYTGKIHLFRDIIRIINDLHLSQIIHNDITPGNIILKKSKSNLLEHKFHVNLIDFSHALDLNTSESHRLQAKPHYASPEQLTNNKLNQKSDIYQAGCLLFEILSNKQYQDITNKPTQNLKTNNIQSTELEKILKSMLSQDPIYRPTARQILKMIDSLNSVK